MIAYADQKNKIPTVRYLWIHHFFTSRFLSKYKLFDDWLTDYHLM